MDTKFSAFVEGEWKSWLKTQHSKNKGHGIQSHHFMANKWGNNGNSDRLIFLGPKITTDGNCNHEIKRVLLLGRKYITNLGSILKSRDNTLLTKVRLVKAMVFSRIHIWMWELDYKESWAPKNWCFWTMVLEKTVESPLDCKEIKSVNPKGNESWMFIGRTDAEVETPIFWQPNVRNQLIGKDLDAEKDWRREEKGMTEDEMVGWHHWCMDMSLSRVRELVMDREGWHATVHGVT